MGKAILGLTLGTAILLAGSLWFISQLVFAQTQNATTSTPTGQQLLINLTNYFKENKEFQVCPLGPPCISSVHVLYQSPKTLALESTFVDTIWKAVDFAKTQGYRVDGITNYITKSNNSQGEVNILVSMSGP